MRATVAGYVAVVVALAALCRSAGLDPRQTATLMIASFAYGAVATRLDRIGRFLRGLLGKVRSGRALARVPQVLPAYLLDGKPLPVEVVETRPWPRSVWVGRGGRR